MPSGLAAAEDRKGSRILVASKLFCKKFPAEKVFKYFLMEGVAGQRERLLFVNELFALENIFDETMKHFEGKMPQISLITDMWGWWFKTVPLFVQIFDAFNLMHLSLLAEAEVLEDTVYNVFVKL